MASTSFAPLSSPAPIPEERRKKKPYKELTLEEKVQLIRLAEENAGMSQASIAERYAIAKSNVCRILQRKAEYIRAYESAGFAGSRKRKLRSEDTLDATSANPAVSRVTGVARPLPRPVATATVLIGHQQPVVQHQHQLHHPHPAHLGARRIQSVIIKIP